MVDYSRAATSRAAKSSFDQAAQNLIAEIQALQVEYEAEWKKVEDLRKSRASLIENIIPILKSNEVKLARPLSKCDNSELMEELSKTVNSLDTTPQEEVRVAMVRIESRYAQLVKQAKKLDALYERLSSYYVPEKDYGDEVVVSIKGHKKSKKDDPKISAEQVDLGTTEGEEISNIATMESNNPLELGSVELEGYLSEVDAPVDEQQLSEYFVGHKDDQEVDLEVSEIPLFGDAPVDSGNLKQDDNNFDDILNRSEPNIGTYSEFDEQSDFVVDDTPTMNYDNLGEILQSGDLEEEYVESPKDYRDDGLEQVISSSPASQELIDEVQFMIDSKKLDDYLDRFNGKNDEGNSFDAFDITNTANSIEEPEYHVYSLNENQTLSQIVDYVYEGNLSWNDVYHYADNEEVITSKCEELGIDVEEAANTPGKLANIDIKYPKNFEPYQEQEKEHKMAA